jgi:hypothetical protein
MGTARRRIARGGNFGRDVHQRLLPNALDREQSQSVYVDKLDMKLVGEIVLRHGDQLLQTEH